MRLACHGLDATTTVLNRAHRRSSTPLSHRASHAATDKPANSSQMGRFSAAPSSATRSWLPASWQPSFLRCQVLRSQTSMAPNQGRRQRRRRIDATALALQLPEKNRLGLAAAHHGPRVAPSGYRDASSSLAAMTWISALFPARRLGREGFRCVLPSTDAIRAEKSSHPANTRPIHARARRSGAKLRLCPTSFEVESATLPSPLTTMRIDRPARAASESGMVVVVSRLANDDATAVEEARSSDTPRRRRDP